MLEGGLIIALVPLAAWWLEIGYLQAFWVDLAFFAFFLPYTYAFNWLYDHMRACYGRKWVAWA
ncbi:chlorhexidine efflux transporter [Chromobacterium sp. ATCC 53434]|uniref:chlorhexidine efflux transporter n=1 Tax=Chromobacterium sp. (strain ATCC 53434 / SC 14030) TaxID=2059672 RepID=UPI001F46F682|nr:chlorhexidine efflux transporter [Chromobacterium sp. ATCC 53434]